MAKVLSRDGLERARELVRTRARALDRALFEHYFEGAPAGAAEAELARYQNEDGGFGHALEPDVRTSASSALCTGIALELLRDLHVPAGDPLVRGGVSYLLANYVDQTGVWPVLPAAAQEAPRAPWWHDDGESLARTFDGFRIIPRAQIVGVLYSLAEGVPAGWLDDVAERTVRTIEEVERLGWVGATTWCTA